MDIDLDAFLSKEDYDCAKYLYYNKRVKYNKDFIGLLPRPKFITIARSQTPKIYTPSDIVDSIEERIICELNKYYKEGRQTIPS